MEAKAVLKQEADGKHPASHYLVVENPEQVTTWHLLVRSLNGDPDHRLMGAAWAALHQGYRGNRYEGPNKQEAIRKLRRLYEAEGMNPPGEKSMGSDNALKFKALTRVAILKYKRICGFEHNL